MACACGKNTSTPPRGSQAARDAAERAKRVAEARAANPATTRIGPRESSGKTQSFTLTVNGKVQTFGSALERDAAAARL